MASRRRRNDSPRAAASPDCNEDDKVPEFCFDGSVEKSAVDRSSLSDRVAFEHALCVDSDFPVLPCFPVVQDGIAHILEEFATVILSEVCESWAAENVWKGLCWAYLSRRYVLREVTGSCR